MALMKFINYSRLIFPSLFASNSSMNYLIYYWLIYCSLTPYLCASTEIALRISLVSIYPFSFTSTSSKIWLISSNTLVEIFLWLLLSALGLGASGLASAPTLLLASATFCCFWSLPVSFTLVAILVAFLVISYAFLGL